VSVVLSDSAREFTGATGLEPATSGVIGRSRPHQADQESPGICSMKQGVSPDCLRRLPGVRGSLRRPRAGCARDGFSPRQAPIGDRGLAGPVIGD